MVGREGLGLNKRYIFSGHDLMKPWPYWYSKTLIGAHRGMENLAEGSEIKGEVR